MGPPHAFCRDPDGDIIKIYADLLPEINWKATWWLHNVITIPFDQPRPTGSAVGHIYRFDKRQAAVPSAIRKCAAAVK
jgi:hypothetical protein